MSRNFLSGIFILIFISLITSCGVSRKNARIKLSDAAKVDTLPKVVGEDPLLAAERQELMATLLPLFQRQIDFRTFSGRAKMQYEGNGQKQEFTANFRIRKDSIMWVSITGMGGIVQVARIYITPDSLKMINYLDREITLMSLTDASQILPTPADFPTLQNLIIGNVLRCTGMPTDAQDLGLTLALQTEEDGIKQQICFSKSDSTLCTFQMQPVGVGPSGLIQYGNYSLVNNQRFSTTRAVKVTHEGAKFLLDMNFVQAAFNQQLDFPFSLPKNFKRK